ncbi:zona pellucida sperm-binding protein 3-like [Hoplias malabaricus]|uniref:zona pellucida sperm-binding protein 3-like n=1 Tax=Hoplias malabaricus TaxID=27720 RepID=UPI0034623DA0
MSFLGHSLCLLVTAAFVFSYEDIHIKCTNDSVVIRWKVNKDLAETPSRLFLGNCLPSKFSHTADGGQAFFHYGLTECGFRHKRTRKSLVYKNELAFRPLPKPSPAVIVYPVVCAVERPVWIQPFVVPDFGVVYSKGRLVFHMGILNDDLSGPALSNSFPLGSFLNIWAAVEQQAHQPLMLFMEKCVAMTTLTLEPESLIYPIIKNKGCLVDGKAGLSRFLPRYHSSSVLLRLQAFNFPLGQEVYIHCKLVVWDPQDLNEEKKACNYDKNTARWELLDDPSRSDLCSCCDYDCSWRVKRSLHPDFQGLSQNVILGPVMITGTL